MVQASKENSVDIRDVPRGSFSKLAECSVPAITGPRVALAAKPLNTDQTESNESKIKSIAPKRRLSHISSDECVNFLPKRSRLDARPIGSYIDKENNDDYDPTDDDEQPDVNPHLVSNEQHNVPMFASSRNSTPVGHRHVELSLARKMTVYSRPNQIDFAELELDFPATNKLPPIPDDDDILAGIEFCRPRFPPPRHIPRFTKEVQRNMHIDLDNFPDLSSDDGSDSGEMSFTDLHTPVKAGIH